MRRMLAAMPSAEVKQFRVVSLLEGLSYVALMGVAMPLKYAAGMPQAVFAVGMVHGLLFVVFLLALARVVWEDEWKAKSIAIAILAALLPLGAFWLERQLKRGAFPRP